MKHLLYLFVLLLVVSCSDSYSNELIFVEPGVNDPFKYPYFLFIPKGVLKNKKNYLIVEPNNSGFVDDDLLKHIEKAKRSATIDFYMGNWIVKKLKFPLNVSTHFLNGKKRSGVLGSKSLKK